MRQVLIDKDNVVIAPPEFVAKFADKLKASGSSTNDNNLCLARAAPDARIRGRGLGFTLVSGDVLVFDKTLHP